MLITASFVGRISAELSKTGSFESFLAFIHQFISVVTQSNNCNTTTTHEAQTGVHAVFQSEILNWPK